MPCGKRPVVKMWDKPRSIRVVKPSQYEQNEASVKVYWKHVIQTLEASYRDETFWASNCDQVRQLVGPTMFRRIAKIFDLPAEDKKYEALSRSVSNESSRLFYRNRERLSKHTLHTNSVYSSVDFDAVLYEEKEEREEDEEKIATDKWSAASSEHKNKSFSSKTVTEAMSSVSKIPSKPFSIKDSHIIPKLSKKSSIEFESISSYESLGSSIDDLRVQISGKKHKKKHRLGPRHNPHFDMLYCNKSETDMIKWKSKYKQKIFEVSASDEFSKKAEILTKKIAKEFFDWWLELGNVEFKSEIKRPEDIEALFQVWFDEHASRGLVLDCKILPCVLQTIADYLDIKKASCPNVLKKHIAYDIHAETSPAHVMAFSTCLPQRMKHIPPRNNTKRMWGPVKIPEDLRSMGCVWDDIQHLTSTKAFHAWLKHRPHLPMPPVFKSIKETGDTKQPFVIPSDFVLQGKSSSSAQELALPVSSFSLELKEFLSKVMN